MVSEQGLNRLLASQNKFTSYNEMPDSVSKNFLFEKYHGILLNHYFLRQQDCFCQNLRPHQKPTLLKTFIL